MLPEGIWGSGGIRSLILNRGFALRTLYTHGRNPFPLGTGACVGGPVWIFLEEKTFTPAGNERIIPR